MKHVVSERTNLIAGLAFDLSVMGIALALLVLELI